MIILEGSDGTGKTTLAKELMGEFGLGTMERGTADRNLLYTVTRRDTFNALARALTGPALVHDRLFYSELVYAPIVGRPVEFSPNECRIVKGIIETLDVPVIVCMPPVEVVQENVVKDDQMDGVRDNIAQIYWDYQDLVRDHEFPLNVLCYDYTGANAVKEFHWYDLPAVKDRVADYLEDRKGREYA